MERGKKAGNSKDIRRKETGAADRRRQAGFAGPEEKEDLIELTGTEEEALTDLAGTGEEEALTDLAGTEEEEDLIDLAGPGEEEALTDLAGPEEEEALADLAGPEEEEDLTDLAGPEEEEVLTDLAGSEEDWEEEPLKPWKTILIFLVLLALAAGICALLWHFSHSDRTEEMGASGGGPGSEISGTGSDQDSENGSGSGASGSPSPGEESRESSPSPGSSGGGESGTEEEEPSVAEPVQGTKDMAFTAVEQSVTPKDVINLRSVPTTLDESNIVVQVQNGTVLQRTGINEETGWSEIEYEGGKLYGVSQYLTMDLDYKPTVEASNPNRVSTKDGRIIIFADCDDWISPKEYVNLRTEPSTSEGNETVSCQMNYGEKAHRTGYSPDSGWSRVEYNGQVLYVVTSLMYTVEEE